MSTNDPARLHSRRAALAGGMAIMATPSIAAGTAVTPGLSADPVFVLIEAERVAFEAAKDACRVWGLAERAFWASEWNRRPRVAIGYSVALCRGPTFDPIPLHEQVEVPFYAHTHEDVDRDCDMNGRDRVSVPADVEARRARLHRDLAADAAAIEAAPEVLREAEAERLCDAACDEARERCTAVFAARPTTIAGLLAVAALAEARDDTVGDDPSGILPGLISAIRSLHGEV